MTGLFRRLARHVVGQPPTAVHAMTSLPFVPSAESASVDDVKFATEAPSASGPVAASASARAEAWTAPMALQSGTPVAPFTANRQATPSRSPTAPTTHPAPTREFASTVAGRVKLAQADIASDTPAPARAVDPPPQALTDEKPLPAAQRLPASKRRTAIANGEKQASPSVDAASTDVPPPMLQWPPIGSDVAGTHPPNPPQVRATHAVGDKQDNFSATASPDEPTEVHVHIGRIEVTALSKAPPARGSPRGGKSPMSLQEYLERRQRGRP
ncbi:MAG: hypothetical protein PVJ33_05935 [Lysobacterales bacterium]